MSDEIYALFLGYPEVKILDENIRITSMAKANRNANLHDYHVILARDPSVFLNSSRNFNDIGAFTGILSLGFLPLCYYIDGAGPITRLDIDYTRDWSKSPHELSRMVYNYWNLMKDIIVSDYRVGKNVEFVERHWAAKILKKYRDQMGYVGSFRLTNDANLLNITQRMLNKYAEVKKSERLDTMLEVFAKCPGSKNAVGGILRVGEATVIMHPLLDRFANKDIVSGFVSELMKGIESNLIGHDFSRVRKPHWARSAFPELDKRVNEIVGEYTTLNQRLERLSDIVWETGPALESAIEYVLKEAGINLENISGERQSGDLLISASDSEKYYVEVKGLKGSADKDDVSNFVANNPNRSLIFIVNHYRTHDVDTRKTKSTVYIPYTPAALDTIKTQIEGGAIKSFYAVTTLELADAVNRGAKSQSLLAEFKKISEKRLMKAE